jgi:eukaryotic-like serine/threonine-protein kinase
MTGSDIPLPFLDSLSGHLVDGRYKVGRLIGKGAMGVVYEAEHVLVGRKVAVKFGYAGPSSSAFERFQREAKAAAAVGNAHIVDVLDMGRLDASTSYMVLERLEGADLAFIVASEGRFSVRRALDVVLQLCDAFSAVHAVGIVHRDLKPENVFLTRREGRADFVKVLDFGVCKVREAGGVRVTATGEAIGTPQFMAPEQAEARSDVDQRADLYSLGALLYFLLAEKPPFEAATWPQLLLQISYEAPPHLTEREHGVPEELDVIVQRALAKNPEQRFQTSEEFKAALEPFFQEVDALASTFPVVRSARPSRADALWERTSTAPRSGGSSQQATSAAALPLNGPGKRSGVAALLVLFGAIGFFLLRANMSTPQKSEGASHGTSVAADVLPSVAEPATSPAPREPVLPYPPQETSSHARNLDVPSAKPVPPRLRGSKQSTSTALASAIPPAAAPPTEPIKPAHSAEIQSAPSASSKPPANDAGVGISRPLKSGI